MCEEKSFFQKIFVPGTAQCAVACAFVGIITALLLLYAGVWKTLLVALLILIGVFIGGVKDKKAFFQKLMDQVSRH